MHVSPSNDTALRIVALVAYHDDLRKRDPAHSRRVWKRARDLAAENGLTIDDVVSGELAVAADSKRSSVPQMR